MADLTDKQEKNAVMGRPRRWNTPEELQNDIDRYFNKITRDIPRVLQKVVGYKDKEKKEPIYEEEPVLDNNGEQIIDTMYVEAPTITGMAISFGCCRDTINEYSHKEHYSDAIKKAKERIENYLEHELYRSQGQVTGIIFNLKNNFGWKDKQEVEQTNTNINIDATQLSEDEINNKLKELLSK